MFQPIPTSPFGRLPTRFASMALFALTLSQPAFANGPITEDGSVDTLGGGLMEEQGQDDRIEYINISARITEVDEAQSYTSEGILSTLHGFTIRVKNESTDPIPSTLLEVQLEQMPCEGTAPLGEEGEILCNEHRLSNSILTTVDIPPMEALTSIDFVFGDEEINETLTGQFNRIIALADAKDILAEDNELDNEDNWLATYPTFPPPAHPNTFDEDLVGQILSRDNFPAELRLKSYSLITNDIIPAVSGDLLVVEAEPKKKFRRHGYNIDHISALFTFDLSCNRYKVFLENATYHIPLDQIEGQFEGRSRASIVLDSPDFHVSAQLRVVSWRRDEEDAGFLGHCDWEILGARDPVDLELPVDIDGLNGILEVSFHVPEDESAADGLSDAHGADGAGIPATVFPQVKGIQSFEAEILGWSSWTPAGYLLSLTSLSSDLVKAGINIGITTELNRKGPGSVRELLRQKIDTAIATTLSAQTSQTFPLSPPLSGAIETHVSATDVFSKLRPSDDNGFVMQLDIQTQSQVVDPCVAGLYRAIYVTPTVDVGHIRSEVDFIVPDYLVHDAVMTIIQTGAACIPAVPAGAGGIGLSNIQPSGRMRITRSTMTVYPSFGTIGKVLTTPVVSPDTFRLELPIEANLALPVGTGTVSATLVAPISITPRNLDSGNAQVDFTIGALSVQNLDGTVSIGPMTRALSGSGYETRVQTMLTNQINARLSGLSFPVATTIGNFCPPSEEEADCGIDLQLVHDRLEFEDDYVLIGWDLQ